jgi:urease beta subunit
MLVDVVEGNVIDTSCCTCGGSSSVFQASTEITFLEESHPAITEVPSTGDFSFEIGLHKHHPEYNVF